MRYFAGLEIRHDDREHANAAEIFRVTNSLKVPLEGTRAVDNGHVMMAEACLQSSVGRCKSSEKEPSSQSQQSDRDPDPTD